MTTPNPAEKKPDTAADDNKTGSQPNGQPADVNTAEGGDEGAQPYRPEGLPEHMYGKNDKETIDRLFKTVDGYRKEQAGKKGIPEKVDDYKMDLPEELAKEVLMPGEDGKDPIYEGMKGSFHREGISQDAAARIAVDFYKHVKDLKGQAQEQDLSDAADFDFKSLGGPEKAKPLVDGATVFFTGLKSTGKISEESLKEIQAMGTYSEGLKVLTELRALLGDKVVPANLNNSSTGGDSEITKDKLDERVADPRYRKGSKEFDQDYYDETTEMFQKYYAE